MFKREKFVTDEAFSEYKHADRMRHDRLRDKIVWLESRLDRLNDRIEAVEGPYEVPVEPNGPAMDGADRKLIPAKMAITVLLQEADIQLIKGVPDRLGVSK
jgi:hypothetical protein